MHAFFLEIDSMDRSSPQAPKSATPAKQAKPGRAYAILKFSSVGIEMAVAITIGLGVGYWLDLQFGTSPALLLVFLGLGIAAGFLGVFRAAREAEAMMQAEQAEAAAPAQPVSGETDPPAGESK